MELSVIKWENDINEKTKEIVRSTAIDIAETDRIRVRVRYDVCKSALTNGIFICIEYPNGTMKKENVDSFEEGRSLCEKYRSEFWNSLNGAISKIFKI